MLNRKPMITASGPGIWRLNSTAGTPISMVFGCASPRASPTGTKSHPTCTLYAKSAGRAKDGSIAPRPIWSPISTPMTCAITAPGPRTGERNGSPTMTERTRRPTKLPASGERNSAIRFPSPVALMSPINSVTKAMNGSTFLMTVSMACRPLWNRMPTTPPIARCGGLERAYGPARVAPGGGGLGAVGQAQVVRAHAGDVDVLGDEPRQRACRPNGGEVDGRDALARVDAAAGRPAAVDDDSRDLALGRRRAEAVHGLAARHLRQLFGQLRDAAAGDRHDLVLLRRRLDDERTAPTLLAALYLDGPKLSALHDRPPKARRPGAWPGTGLCTGSGSRG